MSVDRPSRPCRKWQRGVGALNMRSRLHARPVSRPPSASCRTELASTRGLLSFRGVASKRRSAGRRAARGQRRRRPRSAMARQRLAARRNRSAVTGAWNFTTTSIGPGGDAPEMAPAPCRRTRRTAAASRSPAASRRAWYRRATPAARSELGLAPRGAAARRREQRAAERQHAIAVAAGAFGKQDRDCRPASEAFASIGRAAAVVRRLAIDEHRALQLGEPCRRTATARLRSWRRRRRGSASPAR